LCNDFRTARESVFSEDFGLRQPGLWLPDENDCANTSRRGAAILVPERDIRAGAITIGGNISIVISTVRSGAFFAKPN
jgi:hypothetical protein